MLRSIYAQPHFTFALHDQLTTLKLPGDAALE